MVREARRHDFVDDEEGTELMGGFVQILEERFVPDYAATTALDRFYKNGCERILWKSG